jgi:hypothetical protein
MKAIKSKEKILFSLGKMSFFKGEGKTTYLLSARFRYHFISNKQK